MCLKYHCKGLVKLIIEMNPKLKTIPLFRRQSPSIQTRNRTHVVNDVISCIPNQIKFISYYCKNKASFKCLILFSVYHMKNLRKIEFGLNPIK